MTHSIFAYLKPNLCKYNKQFIFINSNLKSFKKVCKINIEAQSYQNVEFCLNSRVVLTTI